jgi:hypothetical protein
MKRFLILFFLLSAFCLLMLNCASSWTKNNGSSVRRDEIKAMFENYEYVTNYSYFYTGNANDPEAILGIQKNYELVKVSGRINVARWQKFEPGGKILKELVEAMNMPGKGTPYGSIINAPSGDRMGVMYATKVKSSYTDIRLMDGNLIAVTPHNDNSPFGGPGR